MERLRAAILAAFLLFPALQAAQAQDVTLMSRDGSVEISGTLLSFDGEFYRVDSDFGVLTLDGSGVVCEGPGCPDLTAFVAEVTFSGARSMGEVLMPALVESFAIRNGFALRRTDLPRGYRYDLSERESGRLAARFHFRLADSAEGFADLLAQEADVVLSLRAATGEELALARSAGIGSLDEARHARIVALDGLVPLVNISNQVTEIAMRDLARVLAGQVTSWSAFGGPDEPIALHLPAPRLGYDELLRAVILGPAGLSATATAARHADPAALAAAVAADPFALGVGPLSQTGNAQPLALRGPCGAPAEADARTLKTEDYPLTAPLFTYTPGYRLPRIVREFLAYATSPAAQPVVRRAGFVDQFPESIGIDSQGLRLAAAIASAGGEIGLRDLQRMIAALMGKKRLTVTFRFEGGSTALDAQSRSNVALLAEALERGVFDDRRLVFIGFSDGQGPAGTNLALARDRAEAVRDAVSRAARTLDPARVRLDTDAFGEAMPMACDEVGWGRQINRRVEVWLD
jgi:phosphate transport system substrate-binding protein